MKISDRFGLSKTQYELDFIDIDTDADMPLFIDPYHLERRINDPWCQAASGIIKNFFNYVLALVKGGHTATARGLFNYFAEPNETCLGVSKGKPQGRGIGQTDADNFFLALLASPAFTQGLINSLEDCRVFVEHIDNDKISDLSTNLVRRCLIDYTQAQCKYWGIPLQPNVESGFYWDPVSRSWQSTYTDMLIIDGFKRLLVPKAAVVFDSAYSFYNFYQHYALNTLKTEHEHKRTPHLLERYTRKDGSVREFVTKKRLEQSGEAPRSKEFLVGFVQSYPNVFQQLRSENSPAVNSSEITNIVLSDVVQQLTTTLRSTSPGTADATRYHHTVKGVLELLMYPCLTNPQIEAEIHDGRKRIDIVFDNSADAGIFHRAPSMCRLPAPKIFVECKNYNKEVANPELDQLAGRFSYQRGQIGLLVSRRVDDLPHFLQRCSDTYRDGRGLIIPLFDNDIIAMMEHLANNREAEVDGFLQQRVSIITRV